MNLFNILCNNYIEEMANPRGAVKIGEEGKGAMAQRGKANRFGKYQNEEIQPFFMQFVADNIGKEMDYKNLQKSISDFLMRSKERGGVGMARAYADKWSQNLANSLYGVLKNVQSAAQDPQSDPDPISSEEIPSDTDEVVSQEPEEITNEPSRSQVTVLSNPLMQKIYDAVVEKGDEGLTNNDISELADDSEFRSSQKALDFPGGPSNYVKNILRKLKEDENLVKQNRDGSWVAIKPSSEEGEGTGEVSTYDRSEDNPYDAEDTAKELGFLPRDFGQSPTSYDKMYDSVNLMGLYKGLFKKNGLIT